MTDAVLRRGSEADATGICQLLARTFPDNAKSDEAILRWQYFGSPYGDPVIVVMDADAEIVGAYTSIRYPAKVDGEVTQVGLGIDAAIDRSHQARGNFGPMASALYAATGEAGMPLTVCYPNKNSVKGIGRVGWQEIGLLRTHLMPLDAGFYAKRIGLPRFAVTIAGWGVRLSLPTIGYDVSESHEPEADVDAVWTALEPAVRNGVIRDRRWFQWRYADRPGPNVYRYFAVRRRGELCGVAVTTVREQDGADFVFLLELLATNAAAGRSLVHEIAKSAGSVAGVILATLPGTSTSELAKRSGLRLVPQRFEPKQLHFGVVDNVNLEHDRRAERWTLGWGDLDHV
ncbi:MAG TPA: GNAT family N-acetyltransferase [Acidothermaceae bacterium]|jgi:hypothetical protein